jgi:hypothetical protein
VAVDDVGPLSSALLLALGGASVHSGAVAVLVSARADGGARARIGEIELRRGGPTPGSHPAGHFALWPMLEPRLPRELVASSAPDGFARIVIHPV